MSRPETRWKETRSGRPGDRSAPADPADDLLPWRCAEDLKTCSLYWLPTAGFPALAAQRQWLMLFLDRLKSLLGRQFGLRGELFLQSKSLLPGALRSEFLRTAREFCPIMGIAAQPGSEARLALTDEEVKEIADGGHPFDVDRAYPDYVYWFANKQEQKQRDLFFGHGGMTIAFLKPDPKTQPPKLPFTSGMRKHPVFQAFDVDALHAQTFALLDGFQEKSKQLFGAQMEQDPQFEGLRFILPRLESRHFFEQPAQEIKKWFELFDVYVQESPADGGILLASHLDLEQELTHLLRHMKGLGLRYPENP